MLTVSDASIAKRSYVAPMGGRLRAVLFSGPCAPHALGGVPKHAAKMHIRQSASGRGFSRALLLGIVFAAPAWCQAKQSAEDLIKFLTHQSAGRAQLDEPKGCGPAEQQREDREAGRALISLGASALPALEADFDSIEALGEGSRFSFHDDWLFSVYAHIRGPAAYPRLLRMLYNSKLASSEGDLDSAMAVALGLTSYVSDMGGTIVVFGQEVRRRQYCVGLRPSDALDGLILAWETDDIRRLEKSLGPNATASLKSLLVGKTWEELRAELWAAPPTRGVAMGYQFRIPGNWSQPRDRPDGTDPGLVPAGDYLYPPNPEIETLFKDSAGNDCGTRRIRFFSSQDIRDFFSLYLVDDRDLAGLLRAISSCVTAPEVRR